MDSRVTLDYEFFPLSSGVGEHVAEHEQADSPVDFSVRGEYLLDAVFRSEVDCTSTRSCFQMVFREEGSQVWNGTKGLKHMYVAQRTKANLSIIFINHIARSNLLKISINEGCPVSK